MNGATLSTRFAYHYDLTLSLALPIYCVLLGKETADGAISHIEREFLKT